MMKKAYIKVFGRVQGVFYRYSAMNKATEFGLGGWVKNIQDGSVELMCEGDEKDIEKMIAWCNHGPPGAFVEKADVIWENYSGEFKKFKIKY